MSDTELNINLTMMAIRESVMSYYKDTCVDSFIMDTNVKTYSIAPNARYVYERREAENTNPRELRIGSVPIMLLSKAPDKVLIHRGILQRSPELTTILNELERFLGAYLQGVRKEYSDAKFV